MTLYNGAETNLIYQKVLQPWVVQLQLMQNIIHCELWMLGTEVVSLICLNLLYRKLSRLCSEDILRIESKF